MPLKGEKERKLKALKEGKNVRFPYNWGLEIYQILKKEYPNYSKERIMGIAGGIWAKYSVETKEKIIMAYQTEKRDTKPHRRILGRMR